MNDTSDPNKLFRITDKGLAALKDAGDLTTKQELILLVISNGPMSFETAKRLCRELVTHYGSFEVAVEAIKHGDVEIVDEKPQ